MAANGSKKREMSVPITDTFDLPGHSCPSFCYRKLSYTFFKEYLICIEKWAMIENLPNYIIPKDGELNDDPERPPWLFRKKTLFPPL